MIQTDSKDKVQMSDRLKNVNILLAEDAPDNLFLLTLVLEDEGAKVCGVEDGVLALEKLRGSKFDLAILDLSLPGMDGDKVAIQANEDGNAVKKVALTGHISLDKESEDAFDLVLQKPILPEVLVEAVLSCMQA